MVAVVSIEKDDNVWRLGRQVREGAQTRGAVAASWLADDLGASCARDGGGAIARAVVCDDDATDLRARASHARERRAWDLGEDARQRELLVEGGDDDVYEERTRGHGEPVRAAHH